MKFKKKARKILRRLFPTLLPPEYYTKSASKQIDIRTMQPFGRLAELVVRDRKTCLYYDRLYTLFQALQNMQRIYLPGMHIAEVGVYRGGGSRFMATAARELGLADVELHSFDTFEGHAEVDLSDERDNRAVHSAGLFGNTSLEAVQAYLADLAPVHLYKGRIQDNAGKVADKLFGCVHVDVDLYEPTLFTLEFFDSRLVSGGTMVVDDFDCTTCVGIRDAVEEFLRRRPHYAVYALLSAQCVLVKFDTNLTYI